MSILKPECLSFFGRRVAEYRITQGLKQDELANLLGMSTSTLARIENGKDSQFSNIMRVLCFFELEERLLNIIPDQRNSPIEQWRAKQTHSEYRRCRQKKNTSSTTWKWGGED